MTNLISKEQAQEMLRWLNKNRDAVLDLYKNQDNEKGVIAHGENLQNVLEEAKKTNRHLQKFVSQSQQGRQAD